MAPPEPGGARTARRNQAMDTIHVFLGTKAQYIKTAPLVRLCADRGIDYRLIDSGQHARLSVAMRRELGVRDPDVVLGGAEDVASIGGALRWATGIISQLPSPRAVREAIFGNRGGVCVVHGDTPSTLLATLLARRAGLTVAHLESGLRSHTVRHPFPEEAIRLVVMRLAHLLFAPDATAMANLRALGLAGKAVAVDGNTVIEALRAGLHDDAPACGPAIASLHRVENLMSRRRVAHLVVTLEHLATAMPVRFVLHEPTASLLRRRGLHARLAAAGVEMLPLVPHSRFVTMLAAAPLVITDGGSIQEECALLGVPTLLWRRRTERPDGVGANVVVSGYRASTIAAFIADPHRHRRPQATLDRHPSEQILDRLLTFVGAADRHSALVP